MPDPFNYDLERHFNVFFFDSLNKKISFIQNTQFLQNSLTSVYFNS